VMGMYLVAPPGSPGLEASVRTWLANNPGWHRRPPVASLGQPIDLGYPFLDGSYAVGQRANASAVAEAIVDDPYLERLLSGLVSPTSQELEQAVLAQYLPRWQAQLLSEALVLALKTVRDRRRTALIRLGVLVVVVGVVVGGSIYLYKKHAKE
jgi:hypothetical protein